MSNLIVFYLLLFFINNCSLSDKKFCAKNSDCPELEICDLDLNQCVMCLNDINCQEYEICIRGQCKNKDQKILFCGAGKSLAGSFGQNCQNFRMSEINKQKIYGPKCLFNNLEASVKDLEMAVCGCQTGEDQQCGIDERGFLGLCVNNICKNQNNIMCGIDRESCNPMNGGNVCQKKSNGYGQCLCDEKNPASSCKTPYKNHIIADSCIDQRCVCGQHAPCDPKSDLPDCLNGHCVNLSKSP